MSEIDTSNRSKSGNQQKHARRSTTVDLTPMVDLGFLLITFFVFTTTLSQPTVMQIVSPNDKDGPHDKICESCVLTVLLQKENVIQYYEGIPGSNTVVRQTLLTKDGIRNIILKKKAAVAKIMKGTSEMVMIIKSAEQSTFQNFVDILDEVAINDVRHYYIADIEPWDKKLFHLEE